uniref:SEP domain-containing protein n=1 Tax=Ciona savignyi TaxID=51511 RepID=H2Z6V6_CIOSA
IMENEANMLTEFRSITDATEERARFFLESSGWQLPVALSSFFDAGAMEVAPSAISDVKVEPKRTTRSSKFASVHDYKNANQGSSDEEEGQRYYAGGSEHSGELIVGPPRKKNSNDQIKDLFKQAKDHGAETVEAAGHKAEGSTKKKYFQGGGYKLGETEESSEFVPGQVDQEEPGPVNVVLRLWSNGFTVDDGPLRDFNDPNNAEFLQSVKKGQIPRELIRNAHGGEVHVDMEDHRQEEYKAPKKKIKPFSGQGHMLGRWLRFGLFKPLFK